MRFRILGSSSAGNSALICTDRCKVLLDAGFTGKRMETLLAQAGVALEEIDAIFITHEHSDHVSGLRGLTRKRPELQIFANATTARIVQERLPRRLNWRIFENNLPFAFGDLKVSPFSIPHDAYDPVGYHFCEQNNAVAANVANSDKTGADNRADDDLPRSLCWLTDLGYVTAAAARHAAACDLLVVEANHDPDMLERCTTRSWSTKQRIRGRHGHLSNQAAYELLASVPSPRWRHVCLAHISAECNSLEIVERQFAPLRNGAHNLDIHIFDPNRPEPGAEFNLRPQANTDARILAANAKAPTTQATETGTQVANAKAPTTQAKAQAAQTKVQAANAKVPTAMANPAAKAAEHSVRATSPRNGRLTQIEISLNL